MPASADEATGTFPAEWEKLSKEDTSKASLQRPWNLALLGLDAQQNIPSQKTKEAPGHKARKYRLTLELCDSATGHMIKPG